VTVKKRNNESLILVISVVPEKTAEQRELMIVVDAACFVGTQVFRVENEVNPSVNGLWNI